MRILNSQDPAVARILDKQIANLDEIENRVRAILERVRAEGDQAVFDYTRQFDRAPIDRGNFRVTAQEIEAARAQVEPEFLQALALAIDNVRNFHIKQKQNSWLEPNSLGTILGQLVRPLRRVGIYVPGGTAAYPSSVLMNALPAQVAGVKEIAMVSPPSATGELNPYTLTAADACGVTEIYKVGGAQAIAALAFGTQSVPAVEKISGPGNIYVTLAKKIAYGTVDIDMLAGPSEVLIIADESARADFVAADLLSQAEHDTLASAVLVTPSPRLAEAVSREVQALLKVLGRSEIARQSIETYGAAIVTRDLEEAFALANRFAPEHLELLVENPFHWLGKVENAGAIFVGPYSPEPMGDYLAGPNHILPTGGTARFYSPVTVDTFTKKSSVIAYSRQGFESEADAAVILATAEGLDAHAFAVKVRRLPEPQGDKV